jgi:hypothetical protein
MLPISTAADATASALFPALQKGKNRTRFTKFVRANKALIWYVGMSGGLVLPDNNGNVNIGKWGDVENIFYDIVRCNVTHEGKCPVTFCESHCVVGTDPSDPSRLFLSTTFIAALVLAIVAAPVNGDQVMGTNYSYTMTRNGSALPIKINAFWGKKPELCKHIGMP